jgi:hypothetical protein
MIVRVARQVDDQPMVETHRRRIQRHIDQDVIDRRAVARDGAAAFGPGDQVADVVGEGVGEDHAQHRRAVAKSGDGEHAIARRVVGATAVGVDQPQVRGVRARQQTGFAGSVVPGEGAQPIAEDFLRPAASRLGGGDVGEQQRGGFLRGGYGGAEGVAVVVHGGILERRKHESRGWLPFLPPLS